MPKYTKAIHLTATLFAFMIVALAFSPQVVTAAPATAPREAEAVRSPWVVTAEYLGPTVPLETLEKYRSSVLYMSGVIGKYKVERVLKAQAGIAGNKPQASTTILVHQIFHDFTNTTPANSWKFSANSLPAPGSKWILFLSSDNSKVNNNSKAPMYETYGGSYGRWEATGQNLSRVSSLLAAPPATNTAQPAASGSR